MNDIVLRHFPQHFSLLIRRHSIRQVRSLILKRQYPLSMLLQYSCYIWTFRYHSCSFSIYKYKYYLLDSQIFTHIFFERFLIHFSIASIRLCGFPQPLANRHFYERSIRYYALIFLLINLNLGKTNTVQLSRIQCHVMTLTMQKLKDPAVLSDKHIHIFRTELALYLRMYNSRQSPERFSHIHRMGIHPILQTAAQLTHHPSHYSPYAFT